MKRYLVSLICPPLAVYHYKCSNECAYPVAVFWLMGITGIIFAFFGGPERADGISWFTLFLGIASWAVATVWADLTIKAVDDGEVHPTDKRKAMDEHDPFDEVRKNSTF